RHGLGSDPRRLWRPRAQRPLPPALGRPDGAERLGRVPGGQDSLRSRVLRRLDRGGVHHRLYRKSAERIRYLEGHWNHLPVLGPSVAPAGLSHRDRRHGRRSLQSGAAGGRTARHLSAGHRSGGTARSAGRSRRSQHLRAVMPAPRRGHENHSKLGGNLMGLSDLRSRVAVLPLLLAGCLMAAPLQAQEAGERVYIANEYNADISVIDTATDTVIATIPI